MGTVGPTNWSQFTDTLTGTPIQVAGNEAVIAFGSGKQMMNASLGSTLNSGSVYFSFTMSQTGMNNTNTSTTSQYFSALLSSDSTADNYSQTSAARVYTLVDVGSTSTYRLGVGSGTANGCGVSTGFSLNAGEDYEVVVKYDFSTGDVSLWVDPTSESSTCITFDGAVVGNISYFDLRQTSISGVLGTVTLDDLRVATTWSEAVVPEPASSASLAGLGVLGAAAFLRRRKKSNG